MKNNIAEKLKEKMDRYNATILDIQKDKTGVDSYIYMIDQRSLKIKYDKEKPDNVDDSVELEGEVIFPTFTGYIDLFVINNDTAFAPNHLNIKDYPFMCIKFHHDYIEIIDIIVANDSYKKDNVRKGYGTMMVNCVEKICKKYNIPEIRGTLTGVDATTEETKNRRNEFWKSNGFTLNFDDEDCTKGSIIKRINIDDE